MSDEEEFVPAFPDFDGCAPTDEDRLSAAGTLPKYDSDYHYITGCLRPIHVDDDDPTPKSIDFAEIMVAQRDADAEEIERLNEIIAYKDAEIARLKHERRGFAARFLEWFVGKS